MLSLLAATSVSLAACSGNIASPGGGLTFQGASEDDDDKGPKSIDDTVVDPGDPNRPAGAGDPGTPNGVGWSTRFPKLSNVQWENTAQQLFFLTDKTGLSDQLAAEPADKAYDTISAAEMVVGGDSWTRYQNAAENLAEVIVGDDAKLAKISPTGTFKDAATKGAKFIETFGRRAYRRPLSADEKTSYQNLFNAGATLIGGDAYKAGVQLVLEAMLQSPNFLYRVESSAKANADRKVQLSGDEIATRLSYAILGSMPSDELFAASTSGELNSKDGVSKWAGKLLDDPKARDVLVGFHQQTFQIKDYGTQDKDSSLGFDAEALTPALRDEATKFFEMIVDDAGGIAEILTTPVAFVNKDTAKFYGLSGISSATLQRTDLDPETRAGLLTQLGFLSKNATRAGSDPIHRGLTVIRRVVCDEPDPPPMMFMLPTLKPGLTTREVYEQHTVCGGACHTDLINPPGFAFEGFDAVGQVRSKDNGKDVDTSGTLKIRQGYTSAEKSKNPSKDLSFEGAVDLVQQLSVTPRVHECYARNWMEYVLARDLDPKEKGAWEALADTSLKKSSARDVISGLVTLDAFRMRVAD